MNLDYLEYEIKEWQNDYLRRIDLHIPNSQHPKKSNG